jgi:hypothetical protein
MENYKGYDLSFNGGKWHACKGGKECAAALSYVAVKKQVDWLEKEAQQTAENLEGRAPA